MNLPADSLPRVLRSFTLLLLLLAGVTPIKEDLEAQIPAANSRSPLEERSQAATFETLYRSASDDLRSGHADKAAEALTQAVHLQPQNKLARCTLGQAFVQLGDLNSAIDQFQECVRLDPQDVQAYYDLGQAYLRLARAEAAKLLEEDSTSPYARRIFAENFIGKNDFVQAEGQYQLALKAQPEALDLQLAMGELSLRKGKLGEAQGQFQRAVDAASTSVAARSRLAQTMFLQGDFRSALAQLRWIAAINPGFLSPQRTFPASVPAPSGWEKTCRDFTDFAAHEPEDGVLQVMRAACQGGPKSPKGPTLALQDVATRPPPQQARPTVGSEQLRLTPDQFCRAGLCDICEERLHAKAAGSVTGLDSLLAVGQCAYDSENYEGAYRRFLAAEKTKPSNWAAVYWRQESARQLANLSFEQVRQIDPDSYLIHLLQATMWEEQQRPELAVAEYKAAIARRPESANLRALLGHLYWKWERYDDALQESLESLQLDAAGPLANFLAGDALVQKHEPEKSLPYLKKALARQPGFLNAEASLGRALSQLGRFQEAAEELAKVAPADADGAIHYQLYQLYQKLGRTEDAKTALAASEEIRSRRRPAMPPAPDSDPRLH